MGNGLSSKAVLKEYNTRKNVFLLYSMNHFYSKIIMILLTPPASSRPTHTRTHTRTTTQQSIIMALLKNSDRNSMNRHNTGTYWLAGLKNNSQGDNYFWKKKFNS